MEVACAMRQWPMEDAEAEAEALQHVHPRHWTRLASQSSIAEMKPYLSFVAKYVGVGAVQVNLELISVVRDVMGEQVLIYQPLPDEEGNWPKEVAQYKAYCFREIPSTPLLLNLEFDVVPGALHADAYTLAGTFLFQKDYPLLKDVVISTPQLRSDAVAAAVEQGLLLSCNQAVKMFFAASQEELPQVGIFWSYKASNMPPRRRLFRKVNLARMRLVKWLKALKAKRVSLQDEPMIWI